MLQMRRDRVTAPRQVRTLVIIGGIALVGVLLLRGISSTTTPVHKVDALSKPHEYSAPRHVMDAAPIVASPHSDTSKGVVQLKSLSKPHESASPSNASEAVPHSGASKEAAALRTLSKPQPSSSSKPVNGAVASMTSPRSGASKEAAQLNTLSKPQNKSTSGNATDAVPNMASPHSPPSNDIAQLNTLSKPQTDSSSSNATDAVPNMASPPSAPSNGTARLTTLSKPQTNSTSSNATDAVPNMASPHSAPSNGTAQLTTLAKPDNNSSPGNASDAVASATASQLETSKETAETSKPHVDACVPEYLRKALAPELLDNRARIQDMQFYQNILSSARMLAAANSSGHDAFDTLFPVIKGSCPTMKRWPQSYNDDGGKWLCGVEHLAGESNCSIYSLGSSNNFDFELAMAKNTGCHLDTFDCTVKDVQIPPNLEQRLTYHPTCVGLDGVPDKRFKSLQTIRTELDTDKITMLKMDIESSEWPVLRAMFEGDWSALPDQISIEMHYNFPSIGNPDYVKDPFDLALFSVMMHLAGYRVHF